MQFEFIFIGKTTDAYLMEGIELYKKKLSHYVNTKITIIEEEKILKFINKTDYIIVLDELGKEMSSVKFAESLQKIMNHSVKRIVFITGGPYGLDKSIKERSTLLLSFAKFTFTHQMIRLLLLEQVYRAMTILKGEKYHHQ